MGYHEKVLELNRELLKVSPLETCDMTLVAFRSVMRTPSALVDVLGFA